MKTKAVLTILVSLYSFKVLSQNKKETISYPNGKIHYVKYFERGKLVRLISFNKGGKKEYESTFSQTGDLIGPQIEYFDNGLKRNEKDIFGTDPIPIKYLSDSSKFITLVDAQSFKSIDYYPNGNMKSVGYVIHGMRIGYWIFYNEDGKVNKSEFYQCLTKY